MSSQAQGKPIITKNSSEFSQDVYASLPTGDLVILAIAVIQAEESPAAMEEIVSTCFRLFPHSFALKNYFYWPDSAQVTRQLQSAKEKGLLKGSPSDGYELKVKGKQSAKQIAKSLGVSIPVPSKVKKAPASVVEEVEKKEEPATVKVETPAIKEEKTPKPKKAAAKKKVKAVKKAESKKKPALKKQAPAKVKAKKAKKEPAKKKPAPKPKVQPKKTVKQAAKPAKQTSKKKAPAVKKPSAVVAKEKAKAKPKAENKQVKAKAKPASKTKPASTKKEAASAPKIKAQKTKSAAATQLALTLTPPTAKKKVKAPTSKSKVKQEAPPKQVKVETQPATVVSKEEKDKAAKVIKQLERSDAYQLYKRNGKRAQIGEFDFRNMLYATMESSAETLKRNLELFKRYAGVHFRTDLITFLEFCEEHFTNLLTAKTKQSLRKK